MSELTHDSFEDSAAVAARLKALTPARVALGRTGVSQRTSDLLAFQRSHAMARDAVHAKLDTVSLAREIANARGDSVSVLRLHSAAPDRATYLQRPDLGRTLSDTAKASLAQVATGPFDLVFIVADGLSALAVERHASPFLNTLLPQLEGLKIAPFCLVEQGRVAIGDEIGEALSAAISIVLIGERPGLSSPDSLGAYITWNPRPGRSDAERNCISNIRAEGLSYQRAAEQLVTYLQAARLQRLTGVGLKDTVNFLGEG